MNERNTKAADRALCASYDAWLDTGSPGNAAALHSAHAAACPRCAHALASARELDDALEAFAVAPPRELVGRVMARVAETPQRAREAPIEPAFAWWVRAAAEPSTALAGVLAAVVIWRPAALATVFSWLGGASLHIAAGAARALPHVALPGWLSASGVVLALALAALPAVLWGSFRLYAWLERGFLPAFTTVRSTILTDR
jgi:hypothetical protein